MQFSLVEDRNVGQERASRILERVRQAAAQNNTAQNSEGTHKDKKPEPASLVSNATHVKNTIRQEFTRSLTELVSKVKEHDTLSCFLTCVPC